MSRRALPLSLSVSLGAAFGPRPSPACRLSGGGAPLHAGWHLGGHQANKLRLWDASSLPCKHNFEAPQTAACSAARLPAASPVGQVRMQRQGKEHVVRARSVVNCAGLWAQRIGEFAGAPSSPRAAERKTSEREAPERTDAEAAQCAYHALSRRTANITSTLGDFNVAVETAQTNMLRIAAAGGPLRVRSQDPLPDQCEARSHRAARAVEGRESRGGAPSRIAQECARPAPSCSTSTSSRSPSPRSGSTTRSTATSCR